uniref:Uncharacterized protein n=1 Tax=Knipowitschia caucasica TaxID=637954 RepID=A0AAV2J842_KNICA
MVLAEADRDSRRDCRSVRVVRGLAASLCSAGVYTAASLCSAGVYTAASRKPHLRGHKPLCSNSCELRATRTKPLFKPLKELEMPWEARGQLEDLLLLL